MASLLGELKMCHVTITTPLWGDMRRPKLLLTLAIAHLCTKFVESSFSLAWDNGILSLPHPLQEWFVIRRLVLARFSPHTYQICSFWLYAI